MVKKDKSLKAPADKAGIRNLVKDNKDFTKFTVSDWQKIYSESRDADFERLYDLFWAAAPYYFAVLVCYLWPMCSWHYFFKFGVYPWNDAVFGLKYSLFIFFVGMAKWSHKKASPPNNPGKLKWEDFRNPEQLRDNANKRKWENPKQREACALANTTNPKNPLECQKCGCMKVEGVHHCSTCNSCVLAMDHHCPWTANCVGYLTIKPFILFLTYVTSLTFLMVHMCYQVAWQRNMTHVSFLVNFIPPYFDYKNQAMLYFMTPEQQVVHIAQSKQDATDLEDWQTTQKTYRIWINNVFGQSRNSPFYSHVQFYDFFLLYLTLACGLFTLFLLGQTIYYIYKKTSLIDDEKRNRHNERVQKAIRQRQQSNSPTCEAGQLKEIPSVWYNTDTLTLGQLWEAIFGETGLSFLSFTPQYPEDRTVENASKKWLEKQQ